MVRYGEFPVTRPSLLAHVQTTRSHMTWREFYDLYAPAVYRVARLRGVKPNDADDIVQQVMVSIVGHITDFRYDRDRGRFRDWVRRIAENTIIDVHRRHKRMESLSEFDAPDIVDRDISERWELEWHLQDLRYCIEQIAHRISARRMQAFRMYVLDGVSATETALKLNMQVGHVYVTRNQILNLVRKQLRELGEEA